MRLISQSGDEPLHAQALLLLACARLGLSDRRLRLLATGHDAALREWITNDSASPLRQARDYALRTAERLQSLGANMVSLSDDAYPVGLRRLADPPAFLTYRGTIAIQGITIVGTRTPSRRAASLARDIACHLMQSTISGLAAGIDAAVHRGSLDARQPTLAYVGTGIDLTYPLHNRGLQEEIVGAGGGVASEFLPEQNVSRWTLVRRDRLQAAHGAAVLLVASDARGGAMHTMRFARQLQTARFAIEDADLTCDGNRQAISDGAVSLPSDAPEIARRLREISAP